MRLDIDFPESRSSYVLPIKMRRVVLLVIAAGKHLSEEEAMAALSTHNEERRA